MSQSLKMIVVSNQMAESFSPISIARDKVLKIIVKRILDCQNIKVDRVQVFRLASYIEKIMFKSTPSLQEYTNPLTLYERIKKTATIIGLRAISTSAKQSENKHTIQRKIMLRQIVGSELYNEIFDLVSEIASIKRTNRIWTRAFLPRRASCKKRKLEKIKYITIPAPVRLLYFNTALLHAVKSLNKKTSSVEIERVTEKPWGDLVSKARHNLKEFHKFVEKELQWRKSKFD